MTTVSTIAVAVVATLAAIATNLSAAGNQNPREVEPVGATADDGSRSDTDDIDNEVIELLARRPGTVSHLKPSHTP